VVPDRSGQRGGALRLRKRIGLAIASSFATSGLVAVVAGPVYHALPTHRMELFLLAWVYFLGIQLMAAPHATSPRKSRRPRKKNSKRSSPPDPATMR
jgi:hypothetical protein